MSVEILLVHKNKILFKFQNCLNSLSEISKVTLITYDKIAMLTQSEKSGSVSIWSSRKTHMLIWARFWPESESIISKHLPVRSQQYKLQKKVWNMFKVHNIDTTMTPGKCLLRIPSDHIQSQIKEYMFTSVLGNSCSGFWRKFLYKTSTTGCEFCKDRLEFFS